jgi:hypothetical protein
LQKQIPAAKNANKLAHPHLLGNMDAETCFGLAGSRLAAKNANKLAHPHLGEYGRRNLFRGKQAGCQKRQQVGASTPRGIWTPKLVSVLRKQIPAGKNANKLARP